MTDPDGGDSAVRDLIAAGGAYLGIEFGSTRIKACLVNARGTVLATGAHEWRSELVDGFWSYDLGDVTAGMQSAYRALAADSRGRHGTEPRSLAGLGISAMMHGYLAFDADGEILVPFRTWRNTSTAAAAERLSSELGVNIPQRWSIAHLYQAALGGEAHVPHISRLTTLAGHVHRLLTGRDVLGVGDASGMFPLDATGTRYDGAALSRVDALLADAGAPLHCGTLLPEVLPAGADAGSLTGEGALLLDPTGTLQPGAPACPPEGDAGTGMVATGALAPRTGNVSVGTSTFAMVVLERPVSTARAEIDVVATPVGDPVAMVHCNNGADALGVWVGLLREWAAAAGAPIDADTAFAALLGAVDDGAADAGGLACYNFTAGEPVVGVPGGDALFTRSAGSSLSLGNFARAQVYGVFAALSIGMRTLAGDGVAWERLFAHGGLFRTPGPAQRMLAAALGVPVTVARTASEGGAWGIALLAAYRVLGGGQSLDTFVAERLASDTATEMPDPADTSGYAAFLDRFGAGLGRLLAQAAG